MKLLLNHFLDQAEMLRKPGIFHQIFPRYENYNFLTDSTYTLKTVKQKHKKQEIWKRGKNEETDKAKKWRQERGQEMYSAKGDK